MTLFSSFIASQWIGPPVSALVGWCLTFVFGWVHRARGLSSVPFSVRAFCNCHRFLCCCFFFFVFFFFFFVKRVIFEPDLEIMVLFVLLKLILQT